jgi:hypothetical protein
MVERLLRPRARPEPAPPPPQRTTAEKWNAFLVRQNSRKDDRRQQEGRARAKPPARSRDSPVYRRLYEESLVKSPGDASSSPPSPFLVRSPLPAPPSFTENGSRPPRASRTGVVEPDEAEIRALRFSAASQELVKTKPSFRERCEATWDLKAILTEQRAQELEAEDRKRVYADSDQ